MTLILDFGNSSAKWTCYENGKLSPMQRYEYLSSGPDAAIDQIVKNVLGEAESWREVVFVSVVGEAFDKQFAAALSAQRECHLTQFSAASYQGPIQLAYGNAKNFGSDRLAAMIAAEKQYAGNRVIVDCGTAVTIDVLDEKALHLGGLILPSARLMEESLSQNTHAIETGSQQRVAWLANNTPDAVHSGAHYCLHYGLQGILGQLKAELGQETTVILTGGGINEKMSREFQSAEWVPDLVLMGLALWGRR